MLERAIRRTKAYYCLECGICTGSCPVSRYQPQYSPRLMACEWEERRPGLGQRHTIRPTRYANNYLFERGNGSKRLFNSFGEHTSVKMPSLL